MRATAPPIALLFDLITQILICEGYTVCASNCAVFIQFSPISSFLRPNILLSPFHLCSSLKARQHYSHEHKKQQQKTTDFYNPIFVSLDRRQE